ncbi:MAG TPA: outer membrane beta-barrel protein [Bacteroidales bacterium]|nr:outer membrane beta-barrel protein [Bacteroidales bacterium]
MKPITRIALILLFICSSQTVFSQQFTVGLYSGLNLSDIRGQDQGGKWSHKPGPSEGIALGYDFNRTLGFETGLGYSSIYYQYNSYYQNTYPIWYYNSPMYIAPIYSRSVWNMNLGYLRVPFLLTIKIPSLPDLNLKAGVYYSFLSGKGDIDPGYNTGIDPVNKDFGYIFSSGISYPLSDKLKATFNVNYITGKKQFLNDYLYRNGEAEFVAGLNFDLGSRKDREPDDLNHHDTSSVTITYKVGASVSWIPQPLIYGKYYPLAGQILGFSINIPFGRGMEFITGATFERKGYGIKDSSSSYYRLIEKGDPVYYVDTRVRTDYAVIPFLAGLPLGRSQRLYIRNGPWLAFRLGARTTGTSFITYRSDQDYTIQKTYVNDDITRILKPTDAGWLFSAAYTVPLRKRSCLEFDINYSVGFGNVFDDPETVINQGSDYYRHEIKTRALSFTIGYSILPSAY